MRTSIRSRRTRRKIKKDFELPLTSMMDMLVILLVFLLKSYSTSAVAFTTSNAITLPSSTMQDSPTEGINLIIEPRGLILEGDHILDFADAPKQAVAAPGQPMAQQPDFTPAQAHYEIEPRLIADEGRRILPLYDALVKARDNWEIMRAKMPMKTGSDGKPIPNPPFNGTLIIHADKTVQYQVLRKIMYTAGAAEFRVFKLVMMKKDT